MDKELADLEKLSAFGFLEASAIPIMTLEFSLA